MTDIEEKLEVYNEGKEALKERIECARIRGEYIGILKGIMHHDLTIELRNKLKIIIEDLEKDNLEKKI